MRVKDYILRTLSLLMLLCVFTAQVTAQTVSEPSSYTASDEKEVVLKQLTHETVVPHYDFSFADLSSFFKETTVVFFLALPKLFYDWNSTPENTYLAKLFEHHIATNAP